MQILSPRRFGGPDQLVESTIADPDLEANQVLIETSSIGINFADLIQISGRFQLAMPTPAVPGFEFSGSVAMVGRDVAGLQVGQRVLALVPWGAYADSHIVEAIRVHVVPDGMSDREAAAFPVSYATACVSLIHRGSLQAGETVVITGATGNVGRSALQIARAVGATTIAVDRSADLDRSTADHVLGVDDLPARIRDSTNGRGADLALDLVGGDITSQLIEGLAWEGRLVTTGFASGVIPEVPLSEVLTRNVSIIGEDIAGYAVRDPATIRAALQHCIDWYSKGWFELQTPMTHPFEAVSATEVLTAISDGSAPGKHVLSL